MTILLITQSECAIAPSHQLRKCESAIRKCDADVALPQNAIALSQGAKMRWHMGPNRVHLDRWKGCEGAKVRRCDRQEVPPIDEAHKPKNLECKVRKCDGRTYPGPARMCGLGSAKVRRCESAIRHSIESID